MNRRSKGEFMGIFIGIICLALAVTVLIKFNKKKIAEEKKQNTFGKYFED